MIKTFIDAWNKYSKELEEYLRITSQSEYNDYKTLVKLLFDRCINLYLNEIGEEKYDTDMDEITEVNAGDCYGCRLFILHVDVYQPSLQYHVYTHNYYGSSSAADTLMRICWQTDDDLPNEEQIHDYMLLLLNILQQCNYFIEHEEISELNEDTVSKLYNEATD